MNSWSVAPRARSDDVGARGNGGTGTPLLGNTEKIQTSYVPGTGRFVGDPKSPASHNASDAGDDGITLNLVNVPAPQAAKTILGDILAVKYTVDPGIEGKITIQTPKPVAKSAIVDLFQASLRSNGAAIINAGDTYKIVPLEQAAVGANIQVDGTSLAPSGRVGSGLQVVQLKYVSASEIRRILEPISPRGGIVRADDARNTITLSGSAQDINGMLEAISVFDVDVMKGMSFAIVPVKSSQPAAIADELKTVFASAGDGPLAGMVRFLPNKRLGAILVISPQPRYISRAEAWIRKLDAHAEGSEKQFYTYAVQNRGAQELVDVLESMFSSESGRAGSTTARNVSPQYQQASLQSSATQSSFSQQSGSFGGSGASPASLSSGSTFGQSTSPMSAARPSQGRPTTNTSVAGPDSGANLQLGGENSEEPRIKIVADEAKNSVLIEATPADYRRVMRLIGTLDVLPNQVFIETTIAEVSLNDDLKFGLRWSFNNKGSTYTFTDDPGGAISSVFPGFSYALAASNINVTLNALNQITNVNMISSPSLTVMDNKTAYLQIGDEVPITTQSAVSTLTAGAPVVNSVSYKDTGVILGLTPRINESGRVLLDIEQEVSSVAQTTTSGIDSPTINQRRVRTSVVLNDGEALALGGLIQDSKTVTRNQIPILGDIPVVGNAFKQKDNTVAKTELIIVITPHVIRNLTEARRITDEFRRELDTYVPRASQSPRSFEQTVRRTFE